MKTLELSRVHGTWLDLKTTQRTNGSNELSLNDDALIAKFSPEFKEAISLAKLNDYTHIDIKLSSDPEFLLEDLQLVQDDTVHLTTERALVLIELLSNSNYLAAPNAGEIFSSKEDAIAFIHSADYSPDDGIDVIFHRVDGDADSVIASFKRDRWYLVDHAMGGTTTSHPELISAINRLREGFDIEDSLTPICFEQTGQQW
ncbi:hypothetical protein OTK49_03105 [Vibrio coralliirubri]|uniref:hypothetical protein n=1 Tax=Vibrio coralliirubri TaxID=1516159 RepID=UPI00228497B7|nr:hypothetical protein [Vibrio coralliirubri]MCY9861504.1 hypothetical protein [Vibrio coralliirubri]